MNDGFSDNFCVLGAGRAGAFADELVDFGIYEEYRTRADPRPPCRTLRFVGFGLSVLLPEPGLTNDPTTTPLFKRAVQVFADQLALSLAIARREIARDALPALRKLEALACPVMEATK